MAQRPYVIDNMISAKSIAARIEQLAAEIEQEFADTDKLVVVGLLRGSFVFIADLVREINLPIEVDFLELVAGTTSQNYESNCREVFVALEGEPVMKWNGKLLCLNRLDMISVAANDLRQLQATPNTPALLLRIRDTTNP